MILTYLAIGAIIMFLMLNTDKSKESLSTQYIAYRTEAIAEGREYAREIVFRRVFISILFVIAMIAWPLIIGYGIYKAVRK